MHINTRNFLWYNV